MSKLNDFIIEDGELVCYLGDAADIVIPDNVHRIGMGVFIERKNLRSVTLPKSLSWIGQFAFAHCKNLKSITIPASVTFIDKGAFSNSGLEEIIIEGKPEIRLWAFDGTPWETTELKNNGASVCDDVLLSANPELTEYTIPANVKIIGRDAFKNSKIKEIDVPDGVSKLEICAFSYSELERISLPDTLKVVGAHAFSNCTNLTELTIPKSVSHIGDNAFEELENCVLTILNESDDEELFRISPYAFGIRNPSIKEIRVPYGSVAMRYAMKNGLNVTTFPSEPKRFENPKRYRYIDDVFCCEGSTLREYFGHKETVRIPNGIRAIGSNAFTNADVKRVYLPKSVKRIEKFGFANCENLTEVIGKGERAIEWRSFFDCAKLKKAVFPQLEKCYDISFEECNSLLRKNITIPDDTEIIEVKFEPCGCGHHHIKHTPFNKKQN